MSRNSPWPLAASTDDRTQYPVSPEEEVDEPRYTVQSTAGATPPFGAPVGARTPPMSAGRSISPPSVFDPAGEQQEYETQPTTTQQDDDEPGSYDLKPPAPSVQHQNLEFLAGRLFSEDHLDAIIRDPQTQSRFKTFLKNFQREHEQTLARYIETKKAIAAVEYANAVAESLPTTQGHPPFVAAQLDDRFDARSKQTVEDLVEETLPAYITTRLVQLVTESLVKDITGNNAPIMRDLIPNLAEVYCITDPSLPDNPIVYASDEFYNTTQYGKDYVIGRNCRFLQGPKTSDRTVKRLIEALTEGQEICETILNYRRDGSPFINLLMIAPLYDNKGQVRYFLGSQIDVSPLIEGGRGLESFSKLLLQDRADSRFGDRPSKEPKHILEEFSSLLNQEEKDVVMHRTRSMSRDSDRSAVTKGSTRGKRRVIGMDDSNDTKYLWPHPSLGRSGRLPGVYQNYLLVRPYPSLRITFTSPALRIPGLLQTKLLDRIGGPTHVRESIQDAMQHGTGVTAKVTWLTTTNTTNDRDGSLEGRTRWIHCTPMLGSDEKVGVWMIVMVEQEEVTGRINRSVPASVHTQRPTAGTGVIDDSGLMSPAGARTPKYVSNSMDGGRPAFPGRDAGQMTGNKLYAEYLRREGRDAPADRGRPVTRGSTKTSSTAKEQRDVDRNYGKF